MKAQSYNTTDGPVAQTIKPHKIAYVKATQNVTLTKKMLMFGLAVW